MKTLIKEAIVDVISDLGLEGDDFVVEHPTELSHGDYSTNVAMVFAQKNSQNPSELASKIKDGLEGKITHVSRIEIAGPGFINFYLDRDFFKESIEKINKLGDDWGKNETWKGKKVLVEYTDPNPFKEFHIGHLFTNSVGESIARLFMMNGADTKRINYQGDVGLHVAHAIYGMQELGLSVDVDFSARDLGRAYALGAKAYKESGEAQEKIREINKKVYERNDEEINALYDKGREMSLEYFETIYEIIDTQFDEYFFESEAGPKGKEIVESNPDIFPLSEDSRIFDGEKYGLHTRVFLNREGLPTYEAKELALAKMKEDKLGEYNHSVISTSNEINEYFKVLKKAMSFVYPELEKKTEHIGHGSVRLTSGKMSSRTGDVIPAIDFIEEVADRAAAKMDDGGKAAPSNELARDIAISAIKYSTLKGNILHDSVFDSEKALSFEGDSGPYLQYTHARICSVLDQAKEAGLEAKTDNVPEGVYEVEKILYRFEGAIESALKERAPHKVVGFLTDLASEFNSFYAQEKIVDKDDEFAPYKIAIATAVKQTLKNGLWVLAIKAPLSM